jgi:YhcH/YjgK/YiaL family protein
MIVDSLAHSDSYLSLHPLFPAAFAYLKGFDPSTPDGKYPIDGDRLYAAVQRYTTAPEDTKAWETHQVYADIQYIVCGSEKIVYAPAESLPEGAPYNDVKDVQKYGTGSVAGEAATVLKAGQFGVYLPQDGHKPGCFGESPAPVVKVVVKVRLKG